MKGDIVVVNRRVVSGVVELVVVSVKEDVELARVLLGIEEEMADCMKGAVVVVNITVVSDVVELISTPCRRLLCRIFLVWSAEKLLED